MKPAFKEHGLDVEFKGDTKIPDFLMDRDRIYQVFINLLRNAIEAMPHRGKLSIKLKHRGKIASVRFKDTGTGIDEKDLPHIFDPYYTTKDEGSGLGLMTVYSAVVEHGGRVEVESEIDKGSVFTVILPVRQKKLQLPKYDYKIMEDH